MAEPGQGDICRVHDKEIDKMRGVLNATGQTVAALERDLAAVEARVPDDLGQFMGRVDAQLQALARGQEDIMEALKRGYVTVAEFRPVEAVLAHVATRADVEGLERRMGTFALKSDVAPIQSAFWGIIKAIGLALLASLLALLGWTNLPHP